MNCFFSRWNESDEIDRGIEWKEASFIESLMEMMEKNFLYGDNYYLWNFWNIWRDAKE